MLTKFQFLSIDTQQGISIHNITREVIGLIRDSGIRNGLVAVTSQHTTTALTINEDEERLRSDIRDYLERLAPADRPYLHNDIHLRDCDPDEPENAHSHLLAMLLGSSETLAIVEGELVLGQWQSIMLLELDGPRTRRVSVQVMGE